MTPCSRKGKAELKYRDLEDPTDPSTIARTIYTYGIYFPATRATRDWFPRKHNHGCGCEYGSTRRTLWDLTPEPEGHFRATLGFHWQDF